MRIRILPPALLAIVACALGGCAHHSSSSFASPYTTITGSNVATVTVNANNLPLVNVTVCVPGTTQCQTVDNILVDTASSGLRIFASQLSLTLTDEQDSGGGALAECAEFSSFYDWGAVATADVEIGSEKASGVPLQVVGDSTFAGPPVGCTGTGLPANVSASTFGANGTLGVGVAQYDCGATCGSAGAGAASYFACPTGASACTIATAPLQTQVQNPVALFAKDNNGVILSLPAVVDGGSTGITGTLTFGIGTETNNALGNAVTYTTDAAGDVSATFNSNPYTGSYLDSGAEANSVLDAALLTNVTDCPVGATGAGYYCPTNEQDFTATITGVNGTSGTIPFSIANAATQLTSGNTAFDNLAAPDPTSLVWGLPFFFGRNVFVAISGATTPAGAGPFVAF